MYNWEEGLSPMHIPLFEKRQVHRTDGAGTGAQGSAILRSPWFPQMQGTGQEHGLY